MRTNSKLIFGSNYRWSWMRWLIRRCRWRSIDCDCVWFFIGWFRIPIRYYRTFNRLFDQNEN